jgi:propionate CoA-transferase
VVLYVTERAVFSLSKGGLELVEIAPGVEMERDVIDQMEFKPLISESIGTMNSNFFIDEEHA